MPVAWYSVGMYTKDLVNAKSLRRLNRKQRAAWDCCVEERIPQKDAGTFFGLTKGAVAYRMGRAKKIVAATVVADDRHEEFLRSITW